jgi:hypothetical protein
MIGADVSPEVLMEHAVHALSEAICLWVISRAHTLLRPEESPHLFDKNACAKTGIPIRDNVIRETVFGSHMQVKQCRTLFSCSGGVAGYENDILCKSAYNDQDSIKTTLGFG